MINPLRFRSVKDQFDFDELDARLHCWRCQRERVTTPAFFLCHDCGKANSARPYCQPCFVDYHATRVKRREGHKPHPIVQGDPVKMQTLSDGDGVTFAKMHDWVTLDYVLTTTNSDEIVQSTYGTKQPLVFQSGCSGPCVHLQVLGCTDIAAADILGSSDPYCAVYWKNKFVGATTRKNMTLNPTWTNQTFVLPLNKDFIDVLNDDHSSALFSAGALMPKLRVEVYDWDRLSKDDLLGQASINDADLVRILRGARRNEADEEDVISCNLMPRQSQGKLGLRAAVRGLKLLVHVVQAQDVQKADPFSPSHLYCKVYWNNKIVGKTTRVEGTLDPVWNLDIFTIKIDAEGPNSIGQSILRIVCLDLNQFGSDDILGQIELQGWQIKELAESGKADGITSSAEDYALSEDDMKRIYDFVQTYQNYALREDGLDKLVVGVPLDLEIQEPHEAEAADETEAVVARPKFSKKETRDKQKKKNRRSQEGNTDTSKQPEADRLPDVVLDGEREELRWGSAERPGSHGNQDNPVKKTEDKTPITHKEGQGEDKEKPDEDWACVERKQLTTGVEISLGVGLFEHNSVRTEKQSAADIEAANDVESQAGGREENLGTLDDERREDISRPGSEKQGIKANEGIIPNSTRREKQSAAEVEGENDVESQAGGKDTNLVTSDDESREDTSRPDSEKQGTTANEARIPHSVRREKASAAGVEAANDVESQAGGREANLATSNDERREDKSRPGSGEQITAANEARISHSARRENMCTAGVEAANDLESQEGGRWANLVTSDDKRREYTSRPDSREEETIEKEARISTEKRPLALDVSAVGDAERDDSHDEVIISGQRKRNPRRREQCGLGNRVGGVRVAEGGDAESIKPFLGDCCEHLEPLEFGTEIYTSLSLRAKSIDATESATDTDLKKGPDDVEGEKAKDDSVVRQSHELLEYIAVRYRNARVHRFEEDRGVLLEYVDNNTSVWVATKFIPRLKVRSDHSASRYTLKRMWYQRHQLFQIRKHISNVKNRSKVLLEVAMKGSRMQWYQLKFTDGQSGAKFIRGSVNIRLLYHTKGTVLRGLDIAVSQMSLGEKARIEVRPDYGFGEIYAARKVPAYATLVFVAQVAAIGHHNAKWTLALRAAKNEVDEILLRLQPLWLYLTYCSRVISRRFTSLLGRCRKKEGLRKQEPDCGRGKVGENCGLT